MIGSINLPVSIDDSVTRDELANLRLQATAMVSALTTISAGLAAVSSGVADVKARGEQTSASMAQLASSIVTTHEATRQQLTQIQADLAVLRELVPEHKPTFVLNLSVRKKETHG